MRRETLVWTDLKLRPQARELDAEKSTVSARLNEMLNLNVTDRTEKQRSLATGILAYHYKAKVQPNLL